MTEAQLRQQVVDIMVSWLGCKESDGSHQKIIDTYNSHTPRARGYKVKYTDAWCATCVSAAFIKAGLTDIAPVECSCHYMIQLYKAKGWWMEKDSYVPSPGDLIMYDWDDTGKGDCTGAPEHVGMVVSVSGSSIKVIEGNKSDAVGYRTLAVNGKNIRGYCLPNYVSKATGAATSDSRPQTSANPSAAKKPPTALKADPARAFERYYAKTYTVTASALNMRQGASIGKKVIKSLPQGSKVTCYGYYTQNGGTIWLLVKDSTGTVGFCSKKYLK